MNDLKVPVAYQGGKTRLANAIAERLLAHQSPQFYDICCGSGAITLALVARGVRPQFITMNDAGPWGIFWNAIGDGTFRQEVFDEYLAGIPADPSRIQGYLRELSLSPARDVAEVFPILQAGSFGGKAIWIKGGTWQNASFRSYWLPTATSSRRSPVNPMMPMPETLRVRVHGLNERMRGVRVVADDAWTVPPPPAGSVAYIDPPYAGTTGYGHNIDAIALAKQWSGAGVNVYLSESTPLTPNAERLSAGRAKGGISGDRQAANAEWLSFFSPE